jgi:hypothetical protein
MSGAAAAGGTLIPSMVPVNVIVAALAVVAKLLPGKAINNKLKIILRLAGFASGILLNLFPPKGLSLHSQRTTRPPTANIMLANFNILVSRH